MAVLMVTNEAMYNGSGQMTMTIFGTFVATIKWLIIATKECVTVHSSCVAF